MLGARRPSTYKQYSGYITEWLNYSTANNIDSIAPSISQAVNFLETLRLKRHLGYSAVNTARSALAAVLQLPTGIPLGQDPLVRTYMKGVFHMQPPVPRYVSTWDPDVVLQLLKTWSPASTVDFSLLTFKLAVLILLVSAQRIQTLALLDIAFMTVGKSVIRFTIPGLLKQSRPGYKNPEVLLRAYAPDRRLCVLTYFNEYLNRTKTLRGQETALFITTKKPFRKASKDTMSRWVRQVMLQAGIDTSIFKPHSIRGASASAAKRGGATTKEVMDKAGWARESVFRKYYDRPLLPSCSFDVAVLK